jgi:hypothetical protein
LGKPVAIAMGAINMGAWFTAPSLRGEMK